MTIRLAILGSTRGTNLQTLIDAIANDQLDAEIHLVVSNKADAFILERAQQQGIPTQHIAVAGQSREQYDQQVHAALKAQHIDLIVMIGYMRIVSKWFTDQWPHQIINVHPSLLPKHAGLMDLAVHQTAIDAGDNESGCTVHFVNEVVDGGGTLVQKRCTIDPDDTAETLKNKVQALEGVALIETIQQCIHKLMQ